MIFTALQSPIDEMEKYRVILSGKSYVYRRNKDHKIIVEGRKYGERVIAKEDFSVSKRPLVIKPAFLIPGHIKLINQSRTEIYLDGDPFDDIIIGRGRYQLSLGNTRLELIVGRQ